MLLLVILLKGLGKRWCHSLWCGRLGMWATSAHPIQLNGWKQTLWIHWPALKGGPTSGTGGHFHYRGPGRPGTSGWRHGSRAIMVRLVWAWAQSPGAVISHPLLLFSGAYVFRITSPLSPPAIIFISTHASLHPDPSVSFSRLYFSPWHTQTHFLLSYAFQKVQEAQCTKQKNQAKQQGEY